MRVISGFDQYVWDFIKRNTQKSCHVPSKEFAIISCRYFFSFFLPFFSFISLLRLMAKVSDRHIILSEMTLHMWFRVRTNKISFEVNIHLDASESISNEFHFIHCCDKSGISFYLKWLKWLKWLKKSWTFRQRNEISKERKKTNDKEKIDWMSTMRLSSTYLYLP